jgi:hypothetical protein
MLPVSRPAAVQALILLVVIINMGAALGAQDVAAGNDPRTIRAVIGETVERGELVLEPKPTRTDAIDRVVPDLGLKPIIGERLLAPMRFASRVASMGYAVGYYAAASLTAPIVVRASAYAMIYSLFGVSIGRLYRMGESGPR